MTRSCESHLGKIFHSPISQYANMVALTLAGNTGTLCVATNQMNPATESNTTNMKPGRNVPCSCGSNKKYKHCCEGKVASRSPDPSPDEINQLVALYNSRHYGELESRMQVLLGRYPDFGFGWKLLGAAQQMQGKNALAAFQKTAQLMPEDAEAFFNLGVVQRSLGLLDEAIASYRRAVQIKPGFVHAHFNLGTTMMDLGQLENAADSYRRVITLKPDSIEAYSNLGNILRKLDQLDAALASHQRALEINPDSAKILCNLGIVLKDLGQIDRAKDCYQRAMKISPDSADAHSLMGILLKDIGQIEKAVASYRRALEINPDNDETYGYLLYALNYSARYSPAYCLEEAQLYGRLLSSKVSSPFTAWHCEAAPDRLRIGLVSGDFCNHPVGFFLESLLAHLDPERVELFAYPTAPITDALTTRIKPYFAAWNPLFNIDDDTAARQIHIDGIHILVDLSGHNRHNRLPIFARKPSPVEVSWLGYFATTGVAEIDYLIADKTGVPEAHRKNFTEIIWYLPDTRLCFSPPEFDLEVAPLPAKENGYITFGCFQNMSKVEKSVLSAWSEILKELPGAKLRWQCSQFTAPAVIIQLTKRLQQHGIDPKRVELHGSVAREVYLAAYAEVDIILDTFPYPGGTTTCEALWMGVPTLTLAGDALLSRQGASLLTAAGLEDWIVTSEKRYVDKAVALSNNLDKLAALRAGLREQVRSSPLFDAPRFARHFEDALWGMWHERDKQE